MLTVKQVSDMITCSPLSTERQSWKRDTTTTMLLDLREKRKYTCVM